MGELMAVLEVSCIECSSKKVVKYGKAKTGAQRYCCRSADCGTTFQLVHKYNACTHGVKQRIIDMALNGSGIRDTARVLSVAIGTVITTIKKKRAT